MYRKKDRSQLSIEDFILPFGGRLSGENRWVKITKLMPWELIEDLYAEAFKEENPDGRPPLPARIAFGAIYIKEQEKFTDERTVENITENPYMQYFLGKTAFCQEPLFDASLMTHFRKRFTAEKIEQINEELYRRMNKPDPPEGGDNDGTLILDATAAPADIQYPTDLSLLNECRENTEEMIEILWPHSRRTGHKTGYSRKKARKEYRAIAKQSKPRRRKLNSTIRKQAGYVEKNIETLERLMLEAPEILPPKKKNRLSVIREAVKQQQEMIRTKKHSVPNRIVSLRQPHIRPIVRGKARTPVEFGQKLAFSVVDGFTFIDKQSWDNFHEGITLIESVGKYKDRHGVYPQAILADKIYRTRDNLRYCKENGIRLSGPRLGRPRSQEKEADRTQAYQDNCERNMVESRNGIVKRRYGMNLIMATLSHTAETEVALNVLAMNIAHMLRVFLSFFTGRISGMLYYIVFVKPSLDGLR